MARILVIDDQEELRRLYRTALEGGGHTVLDAGDGDLGLSLFRQQAADVVLCDIFMPGKEGLDTIRELARMRPAPAIIAISGGSELVGGDFLRTAHLLGASHTLQKPFSLIEMVRLVERLHAERERSATPET